MADPAWVVIGRLHKTRGRRGELLAELDSTDPERQQKLKEVVLELKGKRQAFEIEEIWDHSGKLVIKLVGIDSISAAEAWERAQILVPHEAVAKPEAGSYSHQELVGCRLETLAGAEIGVVQGVEEYGGPPLLQIEAVDGREILVPFVKAICQDIDVAAKRIRVELPEGLLELP